jgi:hypothetical protein
MNGLTPENFQAPFTAAEGWGTFSQKLAGGRMSVQIALKFGRRRLNTLALRPAAADSWSQAQAVIPGKPSVAASLAREAGRVVITFSEPVELHAGQALDLALT